MKSRARQVWVLIGLAACTANVGCARMRSFNPGTPLMLGSAAPFGKTKPATPANDLYAQEVGRGLSHSRTLLAQDRARNRERNRASGQPGNADGPALHGGNAPLQVALQPPVSVPPNDRASRGLAAAAPATPRSTPPAGPASAPDISATELAVTAPGEPAATEPTGNPLEMVSPTGQPETAKLIEIVEESNARLETLTSYQVPMKRQERVGDKLGPAEEVVLSIRRSPRAVRLEWPDGPSKGREVLYSAEANDGLMHIKMPDTIVPVPPLSMAIDSPMVLRSSRHPITEAGFETIISDLKKNLAQADAPGSPVGKMSYGGLENPGQLEQPSHKVVRVTPNGENWAVYIDPTTKFPVMVEGVAANGDLLERYLFGKVTVDPESLAAADAFEPSQRWGQAPNGLLSRLARAGAGAKAPEEEQTR